MFSTTLPGPGSHQPAGSSSRTPIPDNRPPRGPRSTSLPPPTRSISASSATTATPSFNLRLGETFNAELSWNQNNIDLPEGAFTTNLGRLRLSYSFSTMISLQTLIQYNDKADIWAANLRFAWLRTANTGLYVVYNELQEIKGISTEIPNRSLTIKYSYLFELLK